jgi:hypothetical protein
MADHKRPGGLTALAVLNFVFGGLGALGVLALFALTSAAGELSSALENAGGEVTSHGPGLGMIWVGVALSAVSVVLLLVSGVGYLGMKKGMGQKGGTLYGVVSIISSLFSVFALSTGFGAGTIIGLVYPVLTIVLLNTTFKDDFVNA